MYARRALPAADSADSHVQARIEAGEFQTRRQRHLAA
jgi:hypothetical protein